jgi:predicted metal-dependent phosphotriesterase family hydrolase
VARGGSAWSDQPWRMIDAGYTDRLFLATDWMYGLGIDPTGTMELLEKAHPGGNLFNVRKAIPYLRRLGVTGAQLKTITVENPRAFFARG